MILVIVPLLLAAPATAMDRYGQLAPGAQLRIADPDAGLERLAAAATPADHGHGKPPRSVRDILRDDPNLRAGFAALDNK